VNALFRTLYRGMMASWAPYTGKLMCTRVAPIIGLAVRYYDSCANTLHLALHSRGAVMESANTRSCWHFFY
jgi:hypothetical protein